MVSVSWEIHSSERWSLMHQVPYAEVFVSRRWRLWVWSWLQPVGGGDCCPRCEERRNAYEIFHAHLEVMDWLCEMAFFANAQRVTRE